MLSKAAYSKRWGCDNSTYYKWERNRPELLELLQTGAEQNATRDGYPFCDDLEALCADNGFTTGELMRQSKIARNTIKNWMCDEQRIKRFWDLIEGMRTHVLLARV